MTERLPARRGLVRAGAWLALLLTAGPLPAQDAARPSGDAVLARLDAARQALAARAQAQPAPSLAAAVHDLDRMEQALRERLGDAGAQPIEILDDARRTAARRAAAAAERTQAYLALAAGCRGDDAQAMARALALGVAQLADAPASGKAATPVIDAVETTAQQALFVLHPVPAPLELVLRGSDLLDAQCPNPQVSLSDARGQPAAVQPFIVSATPQRLALRLPDRAALPPGGYLLHVVPQRKAFLRGCTRQPEAVAALQVAAPLHVVVDYTLTAACRLPSGERQLTLGQGSLPAITRLGATVSQPIDATACAAPSSYTVSATAHFGDGDQARVGPLTQPADAGITAGLPGGLSLRWDADVHTLFVRSAAQPCPGAD